MNRPRAAEFAWPQGDRPGPLAFTHVPAEPVETAIRLALEDALPPVRDGRTRLAGLRAGTGPVGRYQLTGPGGSWFIRVSARRGRPGLEKALVDMLARDGVDVSPLTVAGAPLCWGSQTYRVDVRPFIDGRHFDGSPADVLAAAAVLSRAHAALRRFDRQQEVLAAAARRNARVAARRDWVQNRLAAGALEELHDDPAWASRHRAWLEQMVRDFDPYFDRAIGAQCVHGELHQGNVLFRASDGGAVLVDFEESVHVFAPIAWDLSFLVQRFVLAGNPSPDEARDAVDQIRVAYGGDLPALAPMMRQVAWFSMILLLDQRAAEGLTVPAAEYDKFVLLERQASSYCATL